MKSDSPPPAGQTPGYLLDLQPRYLHSCPYLGCFEDKQTSLAFPDGENHCHRLQSPVAIDLAHQHKFCLSADHVRCYVYQQKAPPPAEERAGGRSAQAVLLKGRGVLAAGLAARWAALERPLSDGFKLPFDFFSGNLTLPPDPWGRESFAVPENPFAREFATLVVWLHLGLEKATDYGYDMQDSLRAGAEIAGERGYDLLDRLRDGSGSAVAFLPLLPALLQEQAGSAGSYLRDNVPLAVQRVGARLHVPDELGGRPFARLAFPLMLLLMFAAAFIWWPLPGQTVDQTVAHGATLVEPDLQRTLAAVKPDQPAPPDSETLPPRVTPLSGALSGATLNGGSTDEVDVAAIFSEPLAVGESVAAAAQRSAPVTAQIRATAVPTVLPTVAAFVLGPQEAPAVPLLITPAAPTALPPASPTAPATAVPVSVLPTDNPTATTAPTATTEPTATASAPLPVVNVAYIHTGALNLRSGPGLGYAAVDVAYNREEVYLLDSPGYEPWTMIRLASGSEGWINSNYLVYERPTP